MCINPTMARKPVHFSVWARINQHVNPTVRGTATPPTCPLNCSVKHTPEKQPNASIDDVSLYHYNLHPTSPTSPKVLNSWKIIPFHPLSTSEICHSKLRGANRSGAGAALLKLVIFPGTAERWIGGPVNLKFCWETRETLNKIH